MQRIVHFNLTPEVLPNPTFLFKKKFARSAFFPQFCFIPGEQMSTLWANGVRGLKSTLGQQCSIQEVYPTPPSSSRKKSLGQHFFTILLHSRWTNVHFMGKRRQGLKIDLGATMQRTRSLPNPTILFKKKSLGQHFFTILVHSRWTNVHFMGKRRQGLKIDLGGNNAAYKKFTQPHHPLQRKKSLGQHFFTILLHSRWTNVHFMGKWRQGLKIDLGATMQRTRSLPNPTILFKKKLARSALFHNFASFQVNKCPLNGQMETGA